MNYYVCDLNPFLIQIGHVKIAWYGIMYAISFILALVFVKQNYILKGITLKNELYDTFLIYLLFGLIIGGRLGYVFFYGFIWFFNNPLDIVKVWEGGMSFHGGAIGTILAGVIFCRKHKKDFYTLADPAMPLVALGIALGRLGNFINGELWGKVTYVPWAVIFPEAGPLPRHPTQLYEALLEGVLMAIFLQIILIKTRTKGLTFWLFIGSYGVIRYFIEYIREPDINPDLYKNGLIFGCFSMGQLLSLCMILITLVYYITKIRGIKVHK